MAQTWNDPDPSAGPCHKVNVFRPDRLSGWVALDIPQGGRREIEILVDGAPAARIPCDVFRGELDPARFATRNLGFRAHVPFAAWDGAAHHIGLRTPDGHMLRHEVLTCPDARLAAPGYHGAITPPRAGRLQGWAAHASGPVAIRLRVDGRDAGSDVAVREMPAGGQFSYGFGFVLPARLFDGTQRRVALFAETAAGEVLLHETALVFEAAEAPRLDGSGPVLGAAGLSGAAFLAGEPGAPLDLALRANGHTILRTRTEAESGRFLFPATDLFRLGPADRLEIVAEGYEAALGSLAPDILARSLSARADPARREIALGAPLPLSWPAEAAIVTEAGPRPVAIDVPEGPEATALLRPGVPLDEGTRIEIGGVCLTPRAGAGPERRALGDVLAPDHPRVADVRSCLLDDVADPAGDPDRPEISGAWEVRGGMLTGWALDLVRPGRPLEVALCTGGTEQLRLQANLPLVRPVAGMPALGIAAGLRVDLARAFPDGIPGPLSLHPVGPDGLVAEKAFAGAEDAAAGAAEPPALAALTDPDRPDDPGYDRSLLCAPLDGAAAELLRRAGTARLPPPPDAPDPEPEPEADESDAVADATAMPPPPRRLGPALAEALAALAGETLPRLGDPCLALPHHRRLPSPDALPIAPLLGALPLAAETRAACRRSHSWRPVLRALLSDPLLRDLLDPSDPVQALTLQAVRQGWPEPRVLPDRLDEALPETCAALALFGADGTALWSGAPEAARDAGARLSDIAPGTAYAGLGAAEGWTLCAVEPPEPAPAAPAPETDPDFALVSMRLEGPLCAIELSGPASARAAVLTLGDLQLDVTIENGRVLAVLPQPPGPGAVACDLRLDHAGGPRPLRMPAAVTAAPGAVALERVTPAVDRLTAEIVTSGLSPEDQLMLVAPGEDAAAGETALPRPAPALSGAPAPLAIILPPALLDGQAREIAIMHRGAAGDVPLWRGSQAAGGTGFAAQWNALPDRSSRMTALSRLAEAGRADAVEAVFADPVAHGFDLLAAPAALGTLTALRARLGPAGLPEALEETFDALWAEAVSARDRAVPAALAARQALVRAQPPATRRRYPLAPLNEAACDLAVTDPGTSPEDVARTLADALAGRRFAIARALAEAHAESGAPALVVQRARLALALGDTAGAEAEARRALCAQPGMAPALDVLARSLMLQGRHIEAAATLSGGRGVSAWGAFPPGYETLKQIAALDWAGLTRDVLARDRPEMAEVTARAEAAGGPPLDIGAEGFSLFYACEGPPDRAALFDALRPAGCAQIVAPAPRRVAEMECIGGWALVLTDPWKPEAALLRTIMAQGRPGDAVLRLWRCGTDGTGAPGRPESAGAAIRRDVMTAFGPADPEEFLVTAERILRVKPVLI